MTDLQLSLKKEAKARQASARRAKVSVCWFGSQLRDLSHYVKTGLPPPPSQSVIRINFTGSSRTTGDKLITQPQKSK